MRTLIIASALFLAPIQIFASGGEMIMNGSVKAFDEKTVTLDSRGKTIVAPRKYVDLKSIHKGQLISLRFSSAEINKIKFYK